MYYKTRVPSLKRDLMVEIVNIVGSGELDKEFELGQLYSDIGSSLAKYDPEMYHGMYVKFTDDSPVITLYNSGKYIIVGAETFDEIQEIRTKFLDLLVNQGRLNVPSDSYFKIQNIVGTDNLGENIDLDELIITLGFENAEYDPEKFPGIVYRDKQHACVVLIFRTGKIVVTGAKSKKSVEKSIQKIRDILQEHK